MTLRYFDVATKLMPITVCNFRRVITHWWTSKWLHGCSCSSLVPFCSQLWSTSLAGLFSCLYCRAKWEGMFSWCFRLCEVWKTAMWAWPVGWDWLSICETSEKSKKKKKNMQKKLFAQVYEGINQALLLHACLLDVQFDEPHELKLHCLLSEANVNWKVGQKISKLLIT